MDARCGDSSDRAGDYLAIFSTDSETSSADCKGDDQSESRSLCFRLRAKSFGCCANSGGGSGGNRCETAVRGSVESGWHDVRGEFADSESNGSFYLDWQGQRRVRAEVHVSWIPVRGNQRNKNQAATFRCESRSFLHGCCVYDCAEHEQSDDQQAVEQYFVGAALEFRWRADGLSAAG